MPEDYKSARERWINELPRRLADHQSDPKSGIPAEEVHARLRERALEILSRAGKGGPIIPGDEVDD